MAERSNIVRLTRSLSTGSFEIGENAIIRDFSRRTVPHYLRPSRGSCHDLCKYGRRRAFEEEVVIKSVRKRVIKSSINELRSVKIAVSGEQKKEKLSLDAKSSVTNVRASSDAKTYPRNLDASSGRKNRLPARKSTSPDTTKEIEVRADDDKLSRGNKKTFDVHSSNERVKLVKVIKPLCAWDNTDGKGGRNGDVQTSRKMSAYARKCEPAPSVCKTKRRCRGVKLDQNRVDRVVTEASNGKTLLSTEAGTRKNSVSPLSDSNPSTSFHGEGTKCCSNGTYKLEAAAVNVEHVEENYKLLEVRIGENILESSPTHLPYEETMIHDNNYDTEIKCSAIDNNGFFSDNIVSTEIEPTKENKNTRMELENNELQSISSDHVIPSPPLLPDDEEKEPLTVEIIKKSPKHNENLRKSRVFSSGDIYCRPLKFRSGKVMDLHQDNIIPRKLTFKRRRSSASKLEFYVSDNNKSFKVQPVIKASRKSRMVALEDKTRSPRPLRSEKRASLPLNTNISWRLRLRRVRTTDVKGDCKGSSENYRGKDIVHIMVHLKHQDVQTKKDGQCLLNNVIEETTSKLVESRKSKVKALVGAFETVISLQERKPSLHTAT